MSEVLTVVARIEAKADQIDLVKAEMSGLLAPTRKEAGCIQYDLHQDIEHPAVFWFIEQWKSPEHLQQHAGSTHIAAYRKATADAIASSEIRKMTRVSGS